MNLKALLQQSFVSLTRNWLRSVLTILGISVGVGAFICVVAIGNAGSSKVEDQLQSLGDNFVWIEAGSRARNGIRAGARGSRTLVLDDAHAIIEQVPLIKIISPNVDGHVQVVYGGENWATQYRGVTPEFLQISRWQMRIGSFFTAADVEAATPVCVLGETVVENLFGVEDPTVGICGAFRVDLSRETGFVASSPFWASQSGLERLSVWLPSATPAAAK